jgi:hypothetical protein
MLLEWADGTGIELDEEMAGWTSLTESLPRHLPGCKPWAEWFMTVAFPAFDTNAAEIYVRAAMRRPMNPRTISRTRKMCQKSLRTWMALREN